jgi:epoxyqueuosine reductase
MDATANRHPSDELKAFALEIGLMSLGVARAAPSQTLGAYQGWLDAGFGATMTYLHRHAALKGDPRHLLPSAQSVIVVTLNYASEPEPPDENLPRIARYARGRDYHRVLHAKLRRIAGWIRQRYPGAEDRATVDSAPMLEREWAWQAGLGWFGKNTCLIDSHRGSWFFIGTLLTSVPFALDEPAVGGCGTCRACIDACPTAAIVQREGRWQVDSRRCISYWTIEARGELPPDADTHGWTFGCDICQEVCPFNQVRPHQPLRAAPTRDPDFNARPLPPLEELTEISDAEWDRLSQGSAVRRADAAQIRRNARLILSRRSPKR